MNSVKKNFRFPELEEFKSNLLDLTNFNFSNYSPKEIYHKFYDVIEALPLYHGIFKPSRFNDITFYRARLNINSQKEDISLVPTYSFPPTIVCTENGRANLAGKSVFYCSNDPRAAILECKPEIGDEGYLSVWKGITERNVTFGIYLPKDLPRENDWDVLGLESYESWTNSPPENHEIYSQHFIEIYKLINDKFLNENKPYPITSFLSNEMLYNNTHKDFFVYPSVVAKSMLSNIAFHPNSVLENLRFKKVIKFKVNNIEDGVVYFNLGKVGSLEETKMIWKNSSEGEEKLFTKI